MLPVKLPNPMSWPNLSPEQALLLYDLVENLACAIWDQYENLIVDRVIAEHHRPPDDPDPVDLPF